MKEIERTHGIFFGIQYCERVHHAKRDVFELAVQKRGTNIGYGISLLVLDEDDDQHSGISTIARTGVGKLGSLPSADYDLDWPSNGKNLTGGRQGTHDLQRYPTTRRLPFPKRISTCSSYMKGHRQSIS